jgi:hypothetical protein
MDKKEFNQILKEILNIQEEAINEYKQTTPLNFFTTYKEKLKQLKDKDLWLGRYKLLYIIQYVFEPEYLDLETKLKCDLIIRDLLQPTTEKDLK